MKTGDNTHDLIVTIIKKGWADRVVRASKEAGAEGGTILDGSGTGIHEQKKLLGLSIDPQKDIVLTIIHKEITDKVLSAIVGACNLEKPATGLSFVVELKKVVGIVHLLGQEEKD